MPDPNGFLVVPVAFRADGTIHSLALDNSDRLKVLVDSVTGNITVVQTDPANMRVGNHGWIGGAWQKSPLPFGASGAVVDIKTDSNLSAGVNVINGTSVPSGEYWVITDIAMIYTGTVATVRLVLSVSISSQLPNVLEQPAVVSGVTYGRATNIVLFPGDFLRWVIYNATATDDFYGSGIGYRVDIDQ